MTTSLHKNAPLPAFAAPPPLPPLIIDVTQHTDGAAASSPPDARQRAFRSCGIVALSGGGDAVAPTNRSRLRGMGASTRGGLGVATPVPGVSVCAASAEGQRGAGDTPAATPNRSRLRGIIPKGNKLMKNRQRLPVLCACCLALVAAFGSGCQSRTRTPLPYLTVKVDAAVSCPAKALEAASLDQAGVRAAMVHEMHSVLLAGNYKVTDTEKLPAGAGRLALTLASLAQETSKDTDVTKTSKEETETKGSKTTKKSNSWEHTNTETISYSAHVIAYLYDDKGTILWTKDVNYPVRSLLRPHRLVGDAFAGKTLDPIQTIRACVAEIGSEIGARTQTP